MTGLAAARIEVRAFSVQIMPALATEMVCCSMASCSTERVVSSILSNSSMQQIPLSLSTNAPLSRIKSYVSGSFASVPPFALTRVTYAVRPTAELPFPDV